MMRAGTRIFVSLLAFLLSHSVGAAFGTVSDSKIAQRELFSWTRATFPNPEQDPEACHSSYSRICDPDGLLGTKDKVNLNDKINSFEVMNSLSCSQKGSKDEVEAPIQLAVALVRKMDLSNYLGSGGKDAAGRDMAMGIHDDWGVGSTSCGGTGILMFLSIEDRVIFISTGTAVQKVLTDGRLDNVIAQMGAALRRKDYGDALLRGIDEMEIYIKQGPPTDWPFVLFLGGIISFALFGAFHKERERERYAEVKSKLSKLDKDRALALQGQYESTSCAICLEDFAPPSSDGELSPLTGSLHGGKGDDANAPNSKNGRLPTIGSDGRPLKLLRCGHAFDTSCWEGWISSGHGDPSKCPICKQDVAGSPPPSPSAPSLDSASPNNRHAQGRGGRTNYYVAGQPNYDMFELERAFRLGQLSSRYPRYVRHTDVQRWAQRGYDGTMTNDPTFIRSDPDHSSSSGSSGSRSGGGGFGGGSSAGGRGGSW
mmetsp:Transcript_6436/g.13524  ORF Transcript_6436/g.13524 Transcript_6436/m.13524 type:complete len:483 (+) Transcript_6436:133-1581(+)